MSEVLRVYTDGGIEASGTPGRGSAGGAGVVIALFSGPKEPVILAKHAFHLPREITNQEAEIEAARLGLEAVRELHMKTGFPVVLCSDSAYVINCLRAGWYLRWVTRFPYWYGSGGRPVANVALWRGLLSSVKLVQRELALRLGPSPWRKLKQPEDAAMVHTSLLSGIEVRFEKVKGHSSDDLNTLADELATAGKHGRELHWANTDPEYQLLVP
jgi:ribonuclease HI